MVSKIKKGKKEDSWTAAVADGSFSEAIGKKRAKKHVEPEPELKPDHPLIAELKVYLASIDCAVGHGGWDIEAFKHNVPWPKKEDFIVVTPVTTALGNTTEIREFDEAKYRAAREVFNEADHLVCESFRNNALRMCGYDPSSKLAGVLYSKAWEDGHSSGFHEVYNELDTLSSFINEVKSAIEEDS